MGKEEKFFAYKGSAATLRLRQLTVF
jgi:hypothetical protein